MCACSTVPLPLLPWFGIAQLCRAGFASWVRFAVAASPVNSSTGDGSLPTSLSVSSAAVVLRLHHSQGVLPMLASAHVPVEQSGAVIDELTAALGLAADEISRLKAETDAAVEQVCSTPRLTLLRCTARESYYVLCLVRLCVVRVARAMRTVERCGR